MTTMAKHRATAARRGALLAGISAGGLLLSMVVASPAIGAAEVSCSEALAAYNTEQGQAALALTDAEREEAEAVAAKEALTRYDATHGPGGLPEDEAERGELADNVETQQGESTTARENYNRERQEAEAAKEVADAACRGADGIDARIILGDEVCARATITTDTDRLVRVVTLVPCPDATPAPPTSKPEVGDKVVVIDRQAPKPEVIESDLPVTH